MEELEKRVKKHANEFFPQLQTNVLELGKSYEDLVAALNGEGVNSMTIFLQQVFQYTEEKITTVHSSPFTLPMTQKTETPSPTTSPYNSPIVSILLKSPNSSPSSPLTPKLSPIRVAASSPPLIPTFKDGLSIATHYSSPEKRVVTRGTRSTTSPPISSLHSISPFKQALFPRTGYNSISARGSPTLSFTAGNCSPNSGQGGLPTSVSLSPKPKRKVITPLILNEREEREGEEGEREREDDFYDRFWGVNRWPEIFYKIGLFRGSSLSAEEIALLKTTAINYIPLMSTNVQQPPLSQQEKERFQHVIFDLLEYISSHSSDICNTQHTSILSPSLLDEHFTPLSHFEKKENQEEGIIVGKMQDYLLRWATLGKTLSSFVWEEMNQISLCLSDHILVRVGDFVGVKIQFIPPPYRDWFTNKEWDEEFGNQVVLLRSGSSVLYNSVLQSIQKIGFSRAIRNNCGSSKYRGNFSVR